MTNIPTKEEIMEIISKTKQKNIDIEETMREARNVEFMDEEYIIFSNDVEEHLNLYMEYKNLNYEFLSEEYMNLIYNHMENGGIYITLGHAYEIIHYGDEYQNSGTRVSTWKESLKLYLDEDKYYLGNMESDYGILLIKNGEDIDVSYTYKDSASYGPGMGSTSLSSIENKLDEPIHRALIKLMYEVITFKE